MVSAQTLPNTSIVRKLQSASERMEMIVNTSRILTLDQKIPQAQVNNPEILQLTPLSPNQIQVSAKRPGVTQVNLWTEDKKIHTVDVIVFGDARELSELLKSQFPNASFKVTPVANSVRISGFVDQPQHVPQVLRIAEEYYPKVINDITVSGVQQVLLHVKIMEVSRTKLRRLGFDWTQISSNSAIVSGVSGLAGAVTAGTTSMSWVENPNTGVSYPVTTLTPPSSTTSGNETFKFSTVDGTNAFLGVLEALREDKLMKILAEPTLVTISGRPASFNVGGEIPILTPQSLGTTSIEYKKYGTQLDFVPIVLGNGKIRLEVRPKVSEIDPALSVVLYGVTVPGLRSREVETGVEMKAGQTLAIAGLIQNRIESQRRGLPWVSEVPYLGALFRKEENQNNEIELLILVTPELVDPLDPDQVPPCGPGTSTDEPSDCELYFKGFVEVPRCCGPYGTGGGVEGVPCEGESSRLPGMVLEPHPEPDAARSRRLPSAMELSSPDHLRPSSAAVSQPRMTRYNPINQQIPQRTESRHSRKPLPGFKGRVGYEMLR